MTNSLEDIAGSIRYGDLPETWRVPEIESFSDQKILYDYQIDALTKAARALFLYFNDTVSGSTNLEDSRYTSVRNSRFYTRFSSARFASLSIKQFESPAKRRAGSVNPVFQILNEYFESSEERIHFKHLINCMCFWMATGSGKTIVMIKLVEFLHRLIQRGEIPAHRILLLAPSDHLLDQIQQAVREFNRSGLQLNLVKLKDAGKSNQTTFGDSVDVFFHRSDNISNVESKAVVDFQRYENNGRWYILLDEAHKGTREDSKRQAYYSIMSRNGFQFNFSATFTDQQDILMTVKKFNLSEFLQAGYGKRIMLGQKEFDAFKNQASDFNFQERRQIVLKSLMNLSFVSLCINQLRDETGESALYHSPLLLALVNSVNTKIEKKRNDLWAFFQVLNDIAKGTIETSFFENVKSELYNEWSTPEYLLGTKHLNTPRFGDSLQTLQNMTMKELRKSVFLSEDRGTLQIVESTNSKEIAFQLKTADAPFALIRIGSVTKWKNQLLAGYESTQSLRESSYFSNLENSSITILMGSRSFFESWDSNRPNVIAFINIGVGFSARKFVMQSVGRGVRIQPVQSQRRRLEFLPEPGVLSQFEDLIVPIETLYLYGTNRKVISNVMTSLESEKTLEYQSVSGFELTPVPLIGEKKMPLLVPVYRDNESKVTPYSNFRLGKKNVEVYQKCINQTSDSLLAVRDGADGAKILTLRKSVSEKEFKIGNGEYANISFLHTRILHHLSLKEKLVDRMQRLDAKSDIVHFQEIKVTFEAAEIEEFEQKLRSVAKGPLSVEETLQLAEKLRRSEISQDEFQHRVQGASQLTHRNLTIKNVQHHYYTPIVLSNTKKSEYIQHIIKEPSEMKFLKDLEAWLDSHKPELDGWMFSKIDEHLDNIHIPYFKETVNEFSRFFPDFIFWMCRRKDYQIVFVDPKGPVHLSWIEKVEGYKNLYLDPGILRRFTYEEYNVRVRLILYNASAPNITEYKNYWTSDPGRIFELTI